MHRRCTFRAQVFHSAAAIVLIATVFGARASAQIPTSVSLDPGSTFRIFLKTGAALPSLGEAATVGDRLVFTLIVGDGGADSEYQLLSLPLTSIDVEKTSRYASSMHAAHYAATRGEADYDAVSQEVARALDTLAHIDDPARRVALAEEAKRRLETWSHENYDYRAADIQELAGQFDEVIAQLKAAAGDTQFKVDLSTGAAAPVYIPILKPPTLRESIELALRAAGAADDAVEREAILRSAELTSGKSPSVADLRHTVTDTLVDEQAADRSYAALRTALIARADADVQTGLVVDAQAARNTAVARDEALGHRRPSEFEALLADLDARIEATRAHRAALDHFAAIRPALERYDRRVKPLLTRVDRVSTTLVAIRDLTSATAQQLIDAEASLTRVEQSLTAVKPPADLADVHATMLSAVRFDRYALARRRTAAATLDRDVAQQASSAAAGGGLLLSQARGELAARLLPPTAPRLH